MSEALLMFQILVFTLLGGMYSRGKQCSFSRQVLLKDSTKR